MVRLSSAASITRYKVSGMDWNDCPESNGIGVRNRPERVSGMPRNTHSLPTGRQERLGGEPGRQVPRNPSPLGRGQGAQYKRKYLPGKRRPLGGSFILNLRRLSKDSC